MSEDRYSEIGERFRDVAPKAMLRADILTPSFLDVVGNVRGKACLDLACGDGYYTRLLQDAGAARTVGVDISSKMITLANQEKSASGRDIEYLVGDVTSMPDLGRFDVVTAVFLLHYAKTKEELLSMCQGIAKSTAAGGKFVTVNTNPDFPIRKDHKYSFTRLGPDPLKEGDILTLSHYKGDEKMYSFDFYHWSKETYGQALREARFASVEWHVPQVSQEAVEREGSAFWEDYQQHPNHSIIVCTK